MGELGRRIARIKLQRFPDAMGVVFPGIEIPDRFPSPLLRCLLPDHTDRTGSFSFREDGWKCFGCGRGGDVVDFAGEYHGVELQEAVIICEHALGHKSGDHDELLSLIALVRKTVPDRSPRADWERMVWKIEGEFFTRMRPYLRCCDPTVFDLAWHDAEYVFDEIAEVAYMTLPRTRRRVRETLRRLRTFATTWATGIENLVLSATGKDRLDVALQSPLSVDCE